MKMVMMHTATVNVITTATAGGDNSVKKTNENKMKNKKGKRFKMYGREVGSVRGVMGSRLRVMGGVEGDGECTG